MLEICKNKIFSRRTYLFDITKWKKGLHTFEFNFFLILHLSCEAHNRLNYKNLLIYIFFSNKISLCLKRKIELQ